MIIGENFVWVHFPKCAGTFTEKILKKHYHSDSSVSFDPIDLNNVIWHQTVAGREKAMMIDLSAKAIICNFRRLPAWIISIINFEAARSGHKSTREMYIRGRFFREDGSIADADLLFKRYSKRPVRHWIRVEFLQTDFYHAFSNYLNVYDTILPGEFSQKQNAADREIHPGDWFTPDEITLLYQSNPLWAEHELTLYGNLQTTI